MVKSQPNAFKSRINTQKSTIPYALTALSRCRYDLRSRREAEDEHGATLGPVVAGDLALMVLHHSVGSAQAQPGAFADGFRGVEGIKDALRLADAGAGIGKLQDNHAAFVPHGYTEGSATHFFQGIHGIADDFKTALEKLVGIAPDPRKIGRDVALDPNVLAFQLEQVHLHGALHH